MTKVIEYARVSTMQQAESGLSIDAQRTKLQAYAIAMDLELVDIIVDAGVSAKTLDRPGMRQVIAMLDAGQVDGVLVAKLDRLTRSVKDLGALVETYFTGRCALLSVSDSIDTRTASGRLVLNVLASVSQWEREATAERTRDALAQLRSEGVKLGGEALGWRRTEQTDEHDRRTVEDIEAESDTVSRIIELRDAGLSLRAIAAALAEEGRTTKRGGRWAAETVRKVLKRAA